MTVTSSVRRLLRLTNMLRGVEEVKPLGETIRDTKAKYEEPDPCPGEADCVCDGVTTTFSDADNYRATHSFTVHAASECTVCYLATHDHALVTAMHPERATSEKQP